MITLRSQYDEVAPVNAEYPPDQIDGCEELEEAKRKLSLVHVLIAKTRAKHCAGSWKDNVKDQADVSPDVLQLRDVSDEFPRSNVRLWN